MYVLGTLDGKEFLAIDYSSGGYSYLTPDFTSAANFSGIDEAYEKNVQNSGSDYIKKKVLTIYEMEVKKISDEEIEKLESFNKKLSDFIDNLSEKEKRILKEKLKA